MTTDAPVPVDVACLCPGTPHDGDTVYLRPKLGLHGGMVAQRKIIELVTDEANNDEVMAALGEVLVRYGVDSWTFTDEEGSPLPVTEAAINDRLLADFSVGYPVADAAADLYSAGLLDPLRVKASNSSRRSPTNGSTSRATSSSGTRPKRSKSSSTTTSPTVVTETT